MKKGLAFFAGKGRPLGKGKTNLKRFSRKESLRAEALFSSARWLRPGTFSFGRRRGRKTAAFAGIHAALGAGARGAPPFGRQRTPPAFYFFLIRRELNAAWRGRSRFFLYTLNSLYLHKYTQKTKINAKNMNKNSKKGLTVPQRGGILTSFSSKRRN